jgi:hypothetical protein
MSEELMSKVRPLPADALRQMEQRADELVGGLSGQFHTYSVGTLAEIDRLTAAPCYADEAWRAQLTALAHDLKGLGGTFGYNLITIVAGSICRTVRDESVVTDESLQRRTTALVTALNAIIQFDLKGDGGVQGRDLLATLQLPAN